MNDKTKKKLKFWKKVKSFVDKKIKECYKHTRKCPNCNVWTHEVDGVKSLKDSEDLIYQYMECKQCGYISRWNMMCMIPFSDEPNKGSKNA